jgi:hypothetical protein
MMSIQSPPVNSKTPSLFLQWTLFGFAALLGIELGAGAFTTVVVFPVWAASPEAAIGFRPGVPYYLEEGDFFMFSSTITTLASIVALIAGWRTTPSLRKWIRVASILFIIVAIWSAFYFIPVQDVSFKGEAGSQIPRDELASMLKTFVSLNYVRQVMIVVSFIAALHALGLAYRKRSV